MHFQAGPRAYIAECIGADMVLGNDVCIGGYGTGTWVAGKKATELVKTSAGRWCRFKLDESTTIIPVIDGPNENIKPIEEKPTTMNALLTWLGEHNYVRVTCVGHAVTRKPRAPFKTNDFHEKRFSKKKFTVLQVFS